MVKNYFDAIKTENDRFLPTFKDEILLVDLLRKKEDYSSEIFNEALNNFKNKAQYIDILYVETELMDYNKLDSRNAKYLSELNINRKSELYQLYELEKIINELYKS